MDNIFWKNDISVLYKNTNYKNFIPHQNCSLNENLNRLTRLAFYYFFILYLYNDDLLNNLIGFLLVCIFCVCIYNKYSIVETFVSSDDTIKRKSTKNNPMMNLSVTDYNKNVPGADLNDKNISKNLLENTEYKVEKNKNIINNDTNLFERQFYTMPINSNPDNRHEFLNFLKQKTTCKEDTTKCFNNIPDRLQYGSIKQ